jgi:PAT family beta-lactamase induction signal transducer AmpG
MAGATDEGTKDWGAAFRPYFEREPLAAFFLGISSGFPYAMIASTLASWLSDEGIDIKKITAFALVLLPYNLKPLWAWMIEGLRIPILHRLGRRVSWLLFAGALVIIAMWNLALHPPGHGIAATALAATILCIASATYDIVIDGYRIELLKPEQLGIGSGMSQYGWRIGAAAAGATALVLADRSSWPIAYFVCSSFALFAIVTALIIGEPDRHVEIAPDQATRRTTRELWLAIIGPFVDFFRRRGAILVLLFILIHKIGDTLANLTFRPLFKAIGFSKTEIAIYDVGVGFWALLAGIFVGGVLYARLGMKRSVLLSLILMGVSNFSFAALAAAGHSNIGMAGAIGFENFASGIGGVTVIAYFSALCDLRFTAAQYALISAAASIVGRFLTGTSAGALIEQFGYVNFYLLTTLLALPGIVLFWLMMRAGLIDASVGTAGTVEATDQKTAE